MPRKTPNLFCLFVLALWLGGALAWAQPAVDQENRNTAARAVNLLSFVAVDYPEAVEEGAVRDRGLYRQQKGNVEAAAALLEKLPDKPGRTQLQDNLRALASAIEQRAPAAQIRQRANAAADRFAALYQLPRSPAESLPPAQEALALYQDRCRHCHGDRGDARQAERQLNNPARMANLSLYDFYNVLEPTRNDAHDSDIDGDLSSRERWALAVMVAGFAAPEMAPPLKRAQEFPALVGLPGMAVLRPAELPPEARDALMWWRAHPQETAHLQHPLARAAGLLYLAQAAYKAGDTASAYHQLMLGLREGYVQARPQLAQSNPALTAQLDQEWQALRQSILDRAPGNEVIEKFQRLQANVVRAREQLQPSSGSAIYGWAALQFIIALGVGALLWYRLRRPRKKQDP
ncbi:hypothetical protein [Microbulbifer hydrolyticus]|uniref:High-affinity iron transporter n=1 Tax=Microbulbifer hydrolyticus TaxID=48074 RepID=A0A6P1TGC9_9GAMM|nr:hypothetical protein [Microbulbifer hydrolyticus]MBB5211822.1 high-affinity iron transporter [Microbulbifer hydrolyticus]QHQ40590.1 hypothetical protein GTQ55_17455 [Microbulbifer hydrolyticus]